MANPLKKVEGMFLSLSQQTKVSMAGSPQEYQHRIKQLQDKFFFLCLCGATLPFTS